MREETESLQVNAIPQHQLQVNTDINRYPEIFKFCYDTCGNKKMNILSFGASSGEEAITLAMFFGASNIYGVEINPQMLEKCRVNFKYVNRVQVTKEIPNIEYDMIFCMSVFCRWPETESTKDCSDIYSFEMFEAGVERIHKYLKPNGLLVIYNSNFRFEDLAISRNYEAIGEFKDSGFVHKFSSSNKKIEDNYRHCVFRKI